MVEKTINATVFKDSVDTKVGLILGVSKDDGKVYVKSTSGLFGATGMYYVTTNNWPNKEMCIDSNINSYQFSTFIALQAGDEVVTINGNLVEGMTSTECVGIIKAAKGDITIFAKRGGAAVVEAPPGK